MAREFKPDYRLQTEHGIVLIEGNVTRSRSLSKEPRVQLHSSEPNGLETLLAGLSPAKGFKQLIPSLFRFLDLKDYRVHSKAAGQEDSRMALVDSLKSISEQQRSEHQAELAGLILHQPYITIGEIGLRLSHYGWTDRLYDKIKSNWHAIKTYDYKQTRVNVVDKALEFVPRAYAWLEAHACNGLEKLHDRMLQHATRLERKTGKDIRQDIASAYHAIIEHVIDHRTAMGMTAVIGAASYLVGNKIAPGQGMWDKLQPAVGGAVLGYLIGRVVEYGIERLQDKISNDITK